MRLDFNVLWVDDQPGAVDAQIKSITMHMASEGFEFQPQKCATMGEVEEVISDDVFVDEIDLVLVDWDLGKDAHGEDAIERIRDRVPYKDIVFYSGQAQVVELQRKAYDKKLEGVYCASRAELVDEVVGVFDSLIKKVLDLDHTRGIVMGATSDIDHMVNSCLRLAHDSLDDEGKRRFIGEALRRVDKQIKDINKIGERLRQAPSIDELFKIHMLFTSDNRLRMLAKILELDTFAAYGGSVAAIRSYRDDVVVNRNTLGHAVLVTQKKPDSVVNEAGNVVNIDQMRELRKTILRLRAEFRALLEAMQA